MSVTCCWFWFAGKVYFQYVVECKLSVCHINVLKKYVDCEICITSSPVVAPVAPVSIAQPPYSLSDDGLNDRHSSVSCVHLRNSCQTWMHIWCERLVRY